MRKTSYVVTFIAVFVVLVIVSILSDPHVHPMLTPAPEHLVCTPPRLVRQKPVFSCSHHT